MTDKDREEALYWCREGCGFVDNDHRCEQWCHVYVIPTAAVARIRAEAKAAALREAAERAVKFLNFEDFFDPPEPFDELVAAILADEPTKEE